MCGIGGYLGDARRPRPLDEAALTLRHRGPDAQGETRFSSTDGVPGYLAAARLSILDPSPAAHQPMHSTDGALRLVYNGEIYNHCELRAELSAQGASFRSHSDTEVVLAGYQMYGPSLWSRLRGMFALALWDARRNELWLARDPMGMKPLYYVDDGARFCFASELRALLACGATSRRIDVAALSGYLTWGSVPEPTTLLADVKLLPPGHALRVVATEGRVRVFPPQRFAALDPSPTEVALSSSKIVENLHATLLETAAAHLQSDVPVGLLLSGGVDSTALAVFLAAAKKRIGLRQPLTAFTLATDGAELDWEAQRAAETAQLLELPHTVHHVGSDQALAAAPSFLKALDQPSVDGFNTFLVCQRVRADGCKLVLSGLGGDELFLGYALHRRYAAAWSVMRPAARRLGRNETFSTDLYRRLRRLFSPLLQRLLLRPELHPLTQSSTDASPFVELAGRKLKDGFAEGLLNVRALERQNYLVHTLLRDGDVMSMAHSVELRVPLCDRALWDEVMALGPAGLLPRKQLLVDAAALSAPESVARQLRAVANAKKRGFVLPIEKWLSGPLGSSLRTRFADADLTHAAGLSPRSLTRFLNVYDRAPSSLRRSLGYRLWALYVLLSYVELYDLRVD